MRSLTILPTLFALLSLAAAQTTSSTGDGAESPITSSSQADTPTDTPSSESSPSTQTSNGGGGGGGSSSATTTRTPGPGMTGPADVVLRIPTVGVERIELIVDNLQAEVNLQADVAKLVELNIGVQVGIEKVNLTIVDVGAELDLIIRLGHLRKIVNRTLESLNLNPLLINLIETVGDVVTGVVGAVDSLLGSIVQGNSRINYIIDNLGNIVSEVVGGATNGLSQIVGDYKNNMTFTGDSEQLGNGLTKKVYEYEPLGAIVDIIINDKDQVVQATVRQQGSSSTSATQTATTRTSSAPAETTSSAGGD